MRRAVLPVLAAGVLVAACGPGSAGAQAPATTLAPTTTSAPAVAVPPLPTPASAGNCPYLDKVTAEDANGQHVTTVKLSAPDGQSEPSCFFYRPDGNWQLTVWVYDGSAAVAKAIVNQQAPVATSNPATSPAGWNGGSEPTSTGAVYAVAKGGRSIVVISNQKQTIKTKVITEHVVSTLGW